MQSTFILPYLSENYPWRGCLTCAKSFKSITFYQPMSSDSQLSPPPLHGPASGFFPTSDGREVEIRDVWASNLEEEMSKIRELVEKYNFVAMVISFFYPQHLYVPLICSDLYFIRIPNFRELLLGPMESTGTVTPNTRYRSENPTLFLNISFLYSIV